MATFKSYGTDGIGATEQVLFQPTVKAIVVGLIVSNTYGSTMPITVKLNKGDSVFHIIKARRVEAGVFVDLMQGNKLVLEAGDSISAHAGDTACFDSVISVLEGVS